MTDMIGDIFEVIGNLILIALTVIGVILLVLFLWALSAAIIGAGVYFGWNICNVHSLFGAGEITTIQAFGIGAILAFFCGGSGAAASR